VQNKDGGWGEDVFSYQRVLQAGRGDSTPTQMAWAMMALIAHLPPTDTTIVKGIHYLVRTQISGSFVTNKNGTGIGASPGATWRQTVCECWFSRHPLARLRKFTSWISPDGAWVMAARDAVSIAQQLRRRHLYGAMVYLYSIEAFVLAIVVYCAASRSCTIAVSETNCNFDAHPPIGTAQVVHGRLILTVRGILREVAGVSGTRTDTVT
jgi:hypothetical protein